MEEQPLNEKPANFWMVWNKEDRLPPVGHPYRGAALKEARRLARERPGYTFIILHGTDKVRCGKRVPKVDIACTQPAVEAAE